MGWKLYPLQSGNADLIGLLSVTVEKGFALSTGYVSFTPWTGNYTLFSQAGLENCTRPLVFTSGSSVRASGNCHLLARQDE